MMASPAMSALPCARSLTESWNPLTTCILSLFDGGVPPLSGTLTVNVQVLDANDNSPVF